MSSTRRRTEVDRDKFPHKLDNVCYSDLKVLCSNAGFYIGRTCWVEEAGLAYEDIGSRESGYFRTRGEAEQELASGEFVVRECVENEFAYSRGLPRPSRGD